MGAKVNIFLTRIYMYMSLSPKCINGLAAVVAETLIKDKTDEEIALILHFLNLVSFNMRTYSYVPKEKK